MGFSLKQMFTPPKSIRKFQPKKLGNVSWWKDFGTEVAIPAAMTGMGLGAAGFGPLKGVMEGAGIASKALNAANKVKGVASTAYDAYKGMGPIGKTLVGAGVAGVAANALSGGGGGAGNREKTYRDSFDQSIEDERGRGTRFSDEYEQRALDYDPNESLNTAVHGALAIEMPRVRAAQGSGRRGTGFGMQAQDQYATDRIASMAADMEQYRYSNMRDIGGYGERSRDRTMDADFGRYSTERMAREQAAASKRGMWGSLGSAAINAAGRILASK